jgi:hypothetical protein
MFPEHKGIIGGQDVVHIERQRAKPGKAIFFTCLACHVQFSKLSELLLHLAVPACCHCLGVGAYENMWERWANHYGFP